MGKGNRLKETKYLEQADLSNRSITVKKEKTDKMTKIISLVMAILLVASMALILVQQTGLVMRSAIVTKTDNYKINGSMMSYYVYSQYQTFLTNSYIYQYVSMGYITLDPQYTLQSQEYDTKFNSVASSFGYPTMDSGTWFDYFTEIAKETVTQTLILAELANKNDIALDDDDYEKIDENIDSLKESAKEYGYSTSKYISINYGEGVSKSDICDCLELSTLAAKYYEKVQADIESAITDDIITEYFNAHPEEFYTAKYLTYTFTAAHPATDVSTATAEENQAFIDLKTEMAAYAAALEACNTEKEFKEYIYNYEFSLAFDDAYSANKDNLSETKQPTDEELVDLKAAMLAELKAEYTMTEAEKEAASDVIDETTDADTTTDTTDTTVTIESLMADVKTAVKEELDTNISDILSTASHPAISDDVTISDSSKWIFGIGDDATPADVDSSKMFDSTTINESNIETSHTYTVYYIIEKSDYDKELSKNVCHILISPSDYVAEDETTNGDGEYVAANQKALDEAERILAEYKSGEQTQAAFEALGEKYTSDSNVLYENVIRGQMVTEFEEWIYGETLNDEGVAVARVAGDTDIVETDYGYHIMYFVGDGLETWKVNTKSSIYADNYEAWYTEQAATFTITFSDKAISKIN